MTLQALTPRPAILCALLLGATAAQAAVTMYSSEASFQLATGANTFESFEGVAPKALDTGASATVSTAGFSVAPVGRATLGVQDAADNPGPGFGASATDGTHYLLSYQPNVATGTLHFVFSQAITAFGLNLVDVGETDGTVDLATKTGEASSGFTALSFPPTFGNGTVFFVGFSQATPFTEVFLTVSGVDEAYGLDKVYAVVPGTVPEPGALALSALALAGLGGLRARRRAG